MNKIAYVEWNCGGIWFDIGDPEERLLCIKKWRDNSIIVGLEDTDGKLHNSSSYAESEYMEAFSDFMDRIDTNVNERLAA